MNLPTYPRYKPSGVEWLGEVPEHWTRIALRRISTRYAGGTPDRSNESYWDEGTIPWINSGAVNQGLITRPSAFITEEGYWNSSARWVPEGALVMALAGQGKTKGMVAQTGIKTTCNQSMAAICPSPPTDARYLFWLLASQYEHIRNMAGGEARDGLNLEILGEIPSLKVPSVEQRAIVAFLDRETARIDRLVAKKWALIERLKEKRTALISRTVTRGLPPAAARAAGLPENPPLKSSGVDWIGKIPKHWNAIKVKYVSRVESGHTPSRSQEELWVDCTIPWVSLNDSAALRANDYISETRFQISELGLQNSSARLLPPRAVVFSRDATVGLCAITTRPMAVSQHFIAYLCGHKLIPEYLLFSIKAMMQELEAISLGSTIPTIGMDDVYSLRIPLPPINEQDAVVRHLKKETANLDALVDRIETAIERLQEYRTALITAAVTGKIDVRREVPA